MLLFCMNFCQEKTHFKSTMKDINLGQRSCWVKKNKKNKKNKKITNKK